MPTDDRDKLIRKDTPAKGVRAQTAPPSDEWEERPSDLTPVEEPIEYRTEKRAEAAAGNSKNALALVKQVQKEQQALAQQVKDYAESDKADHDEMKSKMDGITDHVMTTNSNMVTLAGKVGEAVGAVGQLTSQLQLDAQNASHADRIKLTYKMNVREGIWKTVLKVFGAIVIAAAGAYITYRFAK